MKKWLALFLSLPLFLGAELTVSGVVSPGHVLTVRCETDGRIEELNPQFVRGGIVEAGDVLVRLESSEGQLKLAAARSLLAKAEAEKRSEEALSQLREQEWRLLHLEGETVGENIDIREPCRREKEFAWLAATVKLQLAELELERAVIKAPFTGLVLHEDVEEGAILKAHASLGKIADVAEFWAEVSLPIDNLHDIRFEQAKEPGSLVRVTLTSPNGTLIERKGRVLRLLGTADPKLGNAHVLIAIEDPLGIKTPGSLPILLGAEVFVHF